MQPVQPEVESPPAGAQADPRPAPLDRSEVCRAESLQIRRAALAFRFVDAFCPRLVETGFSDPERDWTAGREEVGASLELTVLAALDVLRSCFRSRPVSEAMREADL